jgi:hypothetical protein
MDELSGEEMLKKSIADLTRGLNGTRRDQVLRQAARLLDAARVLSSSGAGPVANPISVTAPSGTSLLCPKGHSINVTIS